MSAARTDRNHPPRTTGTLAAIAATFVVAMLGGDRFVARAHERDAAAPPRVQATSDVEAGRYLVRMGGCNDCHTPGFMEANGQVLESEWLTGSPLGWRGPWGTSYPSNLRLFVAETPEELFVQILKTRKANPPMPWPSVNAMTEQDARAVYRFIKSLGPKGERMPLALGPGDEPQGPYLDMTPKNLPLVARADAR